jgi:hypothetical protein
MTTSTKKKTPISSKDQRKSKKGNAQTSKKKKSTARKKKVVGSDPSLKIKRVKRPDGKDDIYIPIEREFKNFLGLVSIEVDGKKIGALICRKGEDSYKLWFPFKSDGIPAAMTDLDADMAWKKLDAGFKELPKGESLTFRLVSRSTDYARQVELTRLKDNIKSNKIAADLDSQFLEALVTSSKTRIQQLKREGLYQPKTLEIYGSFTIDSDEEYADIFERWINSFLKNFVGFFRKKAGTYAVSVYDYLLKTITSSYLRGFKFWDSLLNDKCGMTSRNMTIEEAWESLWYRFNETPPPPIPTYLVMDSKGLKEVVRSELSLISVLMESGASTPVATRSYVHCNGSYQAVMIAKSKPGQISSPADLLRYMWKSIADLPDVEIITQLRAGNQDLIEYNLARQTNQAVGRQAYAAGKGTVSAKAMVDLEESVDAQKSLYKGSFVLNAAPIVILRRKTQIGLKDACRDFSSQFQRPAAWTREIDYCWTPWIQSLTGMRWDLLNVTPYDREIKFMSSEAASFTPVCNVAGGDKTGLELLSQEGLSPLYINLFGSDIKHTAIFGITGSGKSVLVAQGIVDAILHGVPVSIVDYPRADGTGTFSEFVPFLKGAYFTLSGQAINIMEIPAFRGLSAKEKEDRTTDLIDTILDFILVLVKGNSEDKSLLATLLKAFFNDHQIVTRYDEANTNGFGSIAWENTPTLVDFIGFCSLGRLGLSAGTATVHQQLERIKLLLQGWVDSRIGAAISKPSTIPLDSPLMAIALNQLNNEEDSKVMAMAINLVMRRRQLGFKRSITIFDESPILFSFEEIAAQIGAMVANGRKSGAGVIILAQEAQSIVQSKAGAKVLSGLDVQLIGRLNKAGVKSLKKIMDISSEPDQLIDRCATADFDRIPGRLYSSWLVLLGSKPGMYARYYPSPFLLAAVANGEEETAMRNKLLAECGGDKIRAMALMANSFIKK